MTQPEQQTEERPTEPQQNRMTVAPEIRIQTLETIVGRNAIREATMQAGLEQLAAEKQELVRVLTETTQQRDTWRVSATELAQKLEVLQERLAEYEESESSVVNIEGSKPVEATG